MTKIKLCGLSRLCDIETANALQPEYIGFVFVPSSKRYISPEQAAAYRKQLSSEIAVVGVFVDADIKDIAALLHTKTIDLAQLHGKESEEYIQCLRRYTDKPVIQAFRIDTPQDITTAMASRADYVLLDSGSGGTGVPFDWQLVTSMKRPYFLAGGLTPDNAAEAVRLLKPFGVDVSSGIETAGYKDAQKMQAFVRAVRQA